MKYSHRCGERIYSVQQAGSELRDFVERRLLPELLVAAGRQEGVEVGRCAANDDGLIELRVRSPVRTRGWRNEIDITLRNKGGELIVNVRSLLWHGWHGPLTAWLGWCEWAPLVAAPAVAAGTLVADAHLPWKPFRDTHAFLSAFVLVMVVFCGGVFLCGLVRGLASVLVEDSTSAKAEARDALPGVVAALDRAWIKAGWRARVVLVSQSDD